jgi:hypothetical protein
MSDQFSNAPEDDTAPDAQTQSQPQLKSTLLNPQQSQPRDPSGQETYIDDPDLNWSEDEDDEDEYEDEFDSEDERERAAEGVRVDDEDWEIAEKGGVLFFAHHLTNLTFHSITFLM